MRTDLHGALASAAAVLTAVLALALPAAAQMATEQYIPVGQSPGVSGVTAEIGVVTHVDNTAGIMTIDVGGEEHAFVMTRYTDVWLDRSDEGQPNMHVGYAGLEIGDVVEVNRGDAVAASAGVGDASPLPLADWIKIDQTERD